MDIHPNDKGYVTMVFKLTSPTLQKTLKICVGKPYDEGGQEKYNVYQVSDDNVVVKRIGYYLLEKGSVEMENGDFPIMKIGEPMWDNIDVKVPPPEKKDAPSPVVSKSEFIVIDNDATGDCFYDAMIRALESAADTYSGEKIAQLRKKLGEYISINPQMRQQIIGKYESYKQTDVKRMNQVEGYKEYYRRTENDGEDPDNVLGDFPDIDPNLAALEGNDFFPTKEQEDVIHLLNEYFDKRTDLTGDAIIDTFVKNVNTPQKWVVEDVVAAFQEMSNVQVVPLIQNGSRVEEYMVSDVIPKEQLLPSTKYIFAAYKKLSHFQLVVRVSDKKGAFLLSELPAILNRKVSEYPSLANKLGSRALEVQPDRPEVTVPVVTREELPPGTELAVDAPVVKKPKVKKVPVSEQEVLRLVPPNEGNGTRKNVSDLDGPSVTEEEFAKLQKITKASDAYSYLVIETGWGKHFTEKKYEPFASSTVGSKTAISTVSKIVALVQQNNLDPSVFFKMKKAVTEKKK